MPGYKRSYRKMSRTSRSKGRRAGTRKRVRYNRRTSRKNRPQITIQRGQLSADQTLVKLGYSTVVAVTTGVTLGSYAFRGASLFDPDFTGAGHQPRGFDQYAALYGRYTVYASSIHVTFSTPGSDPINVVVLPRNNFAVSPNTYAANAEVKYAKTRMLTNFGAGAARITHYMSSARMDGVSPATISANQTYSADVGQNPVKQWFWIIGAQAPDGSTAVLVHLTVKVTYYCRFFDRIPPPES